MEPTTIQDDEITSNESSIQPIQPIEKPKNHKTPIIILSIILCISVIAACVFAYLYFSNNSGEGQGEPAGTSQQTTPPTTEPAEETEITDQLLIKDLDEKIAILHNVTDTGRQFKSGYPSPDDLYEGSELSEIQKVTLIFNAIKPDYYLGQNEKDSAIAEQGYTSENAQVFRDKVKEGIKAETMATKYKDVFGKDIIHGSANGEPSCPNVYYNSEYGFYYDASLGCGGTSPFVDYHYKNKYTSDDEHAYVYINVGTMNYEDNKIYCDHIKAQTFSTNPPAVCGTFSGDETMTIDETNHNDYAEYRFVFNKADDGTYYFSKVEKL